MKRLLIIIAFIAVCSTWCIAQDDTRIVDSLRSVVVTQEGREKVKTMIELIWEFYEVSYDDCLDWGEKAIKEAQRLGFVDLEADATYALGMQYGYHAALDLAQDYLKEAYDLFEQVGNEEKAFDALWNQAYFELILGNMDTASIAFQKVMAMAERIQDSMAYALAGFNLGVVQYQRNDFEGAIAAFKTSRKMYELFNDSISLAMADINLATCYGECGRSDEARVLFASVIPRLVKLKDYDYLLLAYKNYGLLFERDLVNYDSARYYFDKALEVTAMEGLSPQDRQTMNNTKADVLVELGNVAYGRMELQQAVDYFEDALALAEHNRYHFGQMHAMVGLGQLYAKQGKASQSLSYLERYTDLMSQSGITMMEHAVRKALILDYARLDRFAEMEQELEKLDEQRASLTRENADLYEANSALEQENADLLAERDDNSRQLAALQNALNHYRLAFFGMLAIALFALALFVAYKIVRKNRAKTKKG